MPPLVQTAHAAEKGIDVHLAPQIVGHIGTMPITATLITVWFAMAVLIILSLIVNRTIKPVPSKLQNIFELIIGSVFTYVTDVLESKQQAQKYFPIIMTIFLFILTMNWTGLLPGVTTIGYYALVNGTQHFLPFMYPPATDLNITIAFAIVAFVTIEVAGVTAIGIWKYGGKFINFKSPLGFVIGLIELISELARLIAFSFRLFGNVFAGETLMVVVMFLATAYVVPVPLMAYEMFVGFIQAFIFAILTLYFIKIAITQPHH